MIGKIAKQGIICFSNMQIRYLKDLCEPCLNAPEDTEAFDLYVKCKERLRKGGFNLRKFQSKLEQKFILKLTIRRVLGPGPRPKVGQKY